MTVLRVDGWSLKNLLQFEVIQKFSFFLRWKKEFIAVQKDGNELKERGYHFFVDFLGFVGKWKNWMLFGFIFLFRWFFGLIRPWFCYVTFLKIPYSLRKFLQFFMIFLGIFSGKKPSWYPHGDLWFSFFCFMCSNFWFIPIMIFSLLQMFFNLLF